MECHTISKDFISALDPNEMYVHKGLSELALWIIKLISANYSNNVVIEAKLLERKIAARITQNLLGKEVLKWA